MAAAPLAVQKYGTATPGLMDQHSAAVSQQSPPPALDAIETLKAVQGLINTYLANGGAVDGRGSIPTPEPSPLLGNLGGEGKRRTEGEEAVREDAGGGEGEGANGVAVVEEEEEGGQMGINLDGSNSTPFVVETTQEAETSEEDREINSQGTDHVPEPSKMDSKEQPIFPPNETTHANGTSLHTPPSPPTSPSGPKQAHLHSLLDSITDNLPHTAADDGARIKAATAALELAAAVRPPGDTVMGWFATMSVVSAVRLFLHWGAFEAIPAGQGARITVAELAGKIGAEEALVARIASMLTSSHVLTHHAPTPSTSPTSISLSHTPTSLLLLPGRPMSAMFSLMYTHVLSVSTVLPAYFDAYGRREPRGPAHIPTSFLAGRPGEDYFSILKGDEGALRDFNLAMRIASRRVPVTGMFGMEGVLRKAEREREGGRTVWVDVGGGDGHTVEEFLREYHPRLEAGRCVVQDLEEVVRVEGKRGKEGGLLEGVRWVGMDFMKEGPVPGALVYYLRHILRDYSTPLCTTILRNITHSMAPDSRVLIAEQVNPDPLDSPGPLPLYAAFKDFSMLSIGGKERTARQFEEIAHAAGLRVRKVWRDGGMGHAVVEMVLSGVGEEVFEEEGGGEGGVGEGDGAEVAREGSPEVVVQGAVQEVSPPVTTAAGSEGVAPEAAAEIVSAAAALEVVPEAVSNAAQEPVEEEEEVDAGAIQEAVTVEVVEEPVTEVDPDALLENVTEEEEEAVVEVAAEAVPEVVKQSATGAVVQEAAPEAVSEQKAVTEVTTAWVAPEVAIEVVSEAPAPQAAPHGASEVVSEEAAPEAVSDEVPQGLGPEAALEVVLSTTPKTTQHAPPPTDRAAKEAATATGVMTPAEASTEVVTNGMAASETAVATVVGEESVPSEEAVGGEVIGNGVVPKEDVVVVEDGIVGGEVTHKGEDILEAVPPSEAAAVAGKWVVDGQEVTLAAVVDSSMTG